MTTPEGPTDDQASVETQRKFPKLPIEEIRQYIALANAVLGDLSDRLAEREERAGALEIMTANPSPEDSDGLLDLAENLKTHEGELSDMRKGIDYLKNPKAIESESGKNEVRDKVLGFLFKVVFKAKFRKTEKRLKELEKRAEDVNAKLKKVTETKKTADSAAAAVRTEAQQHAARRKTAVRSVKSDDPRARIKERSERKGPTA